MSPAPDPRYSFVLSFKLPSWYQSVKHHICWKKKRCTWSRCRETWKCQQRCASTIVAPCRETWNAQSHNYLYLFEFFLCKLFGLNLLLWKILYHGLERTGHWLMPVLFQKTSVFKVSSTRFKNLHALKTSVFKAPSVFTSFYKFCHHSCCYYWFISWLLVVVSR